VRDLAAGARSMSGWLIVTSVMEGLVGCKCFASWSWWPSAVAMVGERCLDMSLVVNPGKVVRCPWRIAWRSVDLVGLLSHVWWKLANFFVLSSLRMPFACCTGIGNISAHVCPWWQLCFSLVIFHHYWWRGSCSHRHITGIMISDDELVTVLFTSLVRLSEVPNCHACNQ